MGKSVTTFLSILSIILITLLIALNGFADESKNPVEVEKDKVYYGSCNPDSINSPCEIELARVLENIPEYQKIRDEKIGADDAHYWVLWKKINHKLNKGYRILSRKYAYDSIGELGYIHNYPDPVPNKTNELIKIITNKR
jgi:hypothetical protein